MPVCSTANMSTSENPLDKAYKAKGKPKPKSKPKPKTMAKVKANTNTPEPTKRDQESKKMKELFAEWDQESKKIKEVLSQWDQQSTKMKEFLLEWGLPVETEPETAEPTATSDGPKTNRRRSKSKSRSRHRRDCHGGKQAAASNSQGHEQDQNQILDQAQEQGQRQPEQQTQTQEHGQQQQAYSRGEGQGQGQEHGQGQGQAREQGQREGRESVGSDSSRGSSSQRSSSPGSLSEAESICSTTTNSAHNYNGKDHWTGALDAQATSHLVTSLESNIHNRVMLKDAGFAMQPDYFFKPAPAAGTESSRQKRLAVALDCEMATTTIGTQCCELCAVDMITGEEIINIGVEPTHPVTSWNTRFSGMTSKRMAQLRAQGRTVKGWQAARSLLFEYINTETVLVGQALHNDLDVLGICHQRIVDTALVTREAVRCEIGKNIVRTWGLKKLTAAFLGRGIQASASGHDCLEDTLATREVLLVCLQKPEVMAKWAAEAANDCSGCSSPGRVYESAEEFL